MDLGRKWLIDFNAEINQSNNTVAIDVKMDGSVLEEKLSFMMLRLTFSIQSYMEYCCHVWGGAPSCYLELLDKLQARICRLLVLQSLPLLNPWLIVKM